MKIVKMEAIELPYGDYYKLGIRVPYCTHCGQPILNNEEEALASLLDNLEDENGHKYSSPEAS